ncbi:hypothetical protein [uncultured Sphingomonas sp.]|uniref:hypothetical protein n=1 Tax=uncultured Sphingomonas sp. TaxID=158754 RepID=UPI0035CA4E86
MLAGLLFATADATDRPDTLGATLLIGGVTLIEYQARLLVAAGVSQIIVVVARLTPELLGAINRLGRRGVAVDSVRSPAEAIARLHPLARIIWLADGLVTTAPIVATLAMRDHDALLVVAADVALPGIERIGADTGWAGAATIDPQRIAEVARMPCDYDFPATLLRVTAQRAPEQIRLPAAARREGHGIERDSRALASKGRAALVAALGTRTGWVDRFLLAPLARLVLPPLVERGVPALGLATAGGVMALIALVVLATGWAVAGLLTMIAATAALALADVLAWLRDDRTLGLAIGWAILIEVAMTILLVGRLMMTDEAMLLAGAAVINGGLAERAAQPARRRWWWAEPIAYPLVLLVPVIAGQTTLGLAFVAIYATVTLAAAIESLRPTPTSAR